jgi:hypothetical protein
MDTRYLEAALAGLLIMACVAGIAVALLWYVGGL